MQINFLKQQDDAIYNQNQYGLELQNVGVYPTTPISEKKQRLSVALLHTKRKVTALESMTFQKVGGSSTSLKPSSTGNQSYQSSIFSDDQFQDAQSQFGNYGDNFSSVGGYQQKSSKKNSQDQQEYDKDSNYSSSDSDESFVTAQSGSPDIHYERIKQEFFSNISKKSKSVLTSPNLKKLPQSSTEQKVTAADLYNNQEFEFSLNSQQKNTRDSRAQSIEQSSKQRRKSSSLDNSYKDKFNIMQIVKIVSTDQKQQEDLHQIEEETYSNFSSSIQSRMFSKVIPTNENQGGLDDKQQNKQILCRSSCINQFNNGNMTFQSTVDSIDISNKLNQSYLKDDNSSSILGFDQSYQKVSKKQNKEKNSNVPQLRTTSNYLDNRRTLQCLTQLQLPLSIDKNKQIKEQNAQLPVNNQYQMNKSLNYYRYQKKNSSTLATNRILEIKKNYRSRNQEQKAFKEFTLNITYILSQEIQKNKFSLILFQFLQIWSFFLRYYFYFFSLYMMIADSSYSQYLLPMILLPRIFYIFSIYKVIFSYQNHTKSYRQVSLIFNSGFGFDDYFQIMNMNQLLTSDSFEKLTKEKIIARFQFILCPSELNIFTLNKDIVTFSKRKELWYLSNYILISIEYISIYIIMIFFSIYNHQFQKEFQLKENFSLNIFTFSFIYNAVSVIFFIIYNLYYLRKGNQKLKKDNLNVYNKNKRQTK
ncbi:glutamyl-tRNA synthetase protein, putative (macronuclear) [Tetrahymena thermophila SB210]|uniref:Glutamyl-tRNA synthetase protein, putative n=1 Tax=Tetrahymena thermophila (strain SB210) TaxID=312017 RepID=W7X8C2_TETTS|nr:glutamyl-tRNA synthetase protein, putative [Tetrahymena thermophila SB210]EWS72653.1 glutamyl-tRNA synthetase protein, putative [Tetrahymena thermophila SB210]|eukprot:XP_012654821.1 glutamyl-tRNA synthetase protein, putative [Tetrahymena thermophila SB210]